MLGAGETHWDTRGRMAGFAPARVKSRVNCISRWGSMLPPGVPVSMLMLNFPDSSSTIPET